MTSQPTAARQEALAAAPHFLHKRHGLKRGAQWLVPTGLVILGIAGICSLAVTTHMKHTDQARKAWEAWQDYYVRMYPQYYRRR